jgi:LacI family transcriptional regulator
LTNPYFPEVLGPLIEELEHAGYRSVVYSSRQSDEMLSQQLTDGSIDGAVLASCTIDSPLPEMLNRRGLPFVLVNRDVYEVDADRCLADNRAGAIIAARTVLDLGHRQIALILGGSQASTSLEREAGYREAFAEYGLEVDSRLVRHSEFNSENGCTALTELLDSGLPFTAVLCANDVIAVGALNAAADRGLEVPRELTVIGFDDISLAGWHQIQLSTIHQDTKEMGRMGARMLIERMADPNMPRQFRRVQAELVLRGTHAVCPIGN